MKTVLILSLILFISPAVVATSCSEYAAKCHGELCGIIKPHITVKIEHTEKYEQVSGKMFIPYITYGYGDLKGKKYKKKRISYVCLINSDYMPLWSSVIPR